MKRWLWMVVVLPALAGCASSRYCERGAETYENAAEQPPLQAPEGLQVPPPDPNFAIPEATGEDVRYATAGTDARGRRATTCLDAPPPLPPARSVPEPESEAGVEAPAEPDDGQPAAEPGS